MTAVATTTVPHMSRWLTEAVRRETTVYPGTPPMAYGPGVREEAGRLLAAAEARLRPATRDEWRRFLLPLLAVVRQPPGKAQFDDFCGVVASSLSTIPAILLTPNRQGEACRKFAWWPAAAYLADWLEPEARRERATVTALRDIAAITPPRMRRVEPTEAEKAAVRAQAEAFAAEVAARQVAAARRPPRPLPIPPRVLAEKYRLMAQEEGAAGDLARARLAQLDPEGDDA